jgi:hypothetical protein
MCLALYKPAGIAPDWNALETGMMYNSDGAGFAVAVDGQLIVEKGFFKFEHFKKALEPFGEHAAIIHFRISTHGKVNQANCHPFDMRTFGDSGGTPLAVIHNGMFFEASNDNPAFSDTWHICRDILHPMWLNDEGYFKRPEFIQMGDMMVGRSNKLVFLNANGDFAIWGEGNGHWNGGAWWSNRSYEDWSVADPRGAYGSRKKQSWTSVKNPDGSWSYKAIKDEAESPLVTEDRKVIGYAPASKTLSEQDIDLMEEDEWRDYLSARTLKESEGGWGVDDEPEEEDIYNLILAEIGEENEWIIEELSECGYTISDLEMMASRKDGVGALKDELESIYGIAIPNKETLKRISHV